MRAARTIAHIPCLNASPEGMKVIEHMVRQELFGLDSTDYLST